MFKNSSGLDWLQGGGQMGELIAAIDWTRTPLGPLAQWPASLRTTVSLCLASNFPINIIWGDEHNQIYNDGYRVLCGAAHPRAMGQDYRVTWASAWPAIGEPFERALRGETSYLENVRMFLERNGYFEETFFTFSLSPIRDEAGKVVGLFHPVTETTPTMLAERRTRVLREVAEGAGQTTGFAEACTRLLETLGTFGYDLPFTALYEWNAEAKSVRLVGGTGGGEHDARAWPFSQALGGGQPLLELDLEATVGAIGCAVYPEPMRRALLLPVRVPGVEAPLAFLVVGVSPRLPFDERYRTFLQMLADAVSAALGAARAYAVERERAQALAELDRSKTRFFANVSHELRTPLTLMLGPLEDSLADARAPLPAGQRKRVELVQRGAVRMLKLVNQLLEFMRLESGRAQAHFEPTDLGTFSRELVGQFESAAHRAGLMLSFTSEPLRAPVPVDKEAWERIVFNLLSNALKYTLEGSVHVDLREVGDHVELTVQDTGSGIPAAALPQLFQRFYRVDTAEGRSHEGSGIGLALVQELVKLHGGNVQVESEPGKGSIFRVRLPVGKPETRAPSEPTRLGPEPASPRRRALAQGFVQEVESWATSQRDQGRQGEQELPLLSQGARSGSVLVVDDNADLRTYLTSVLASELEVRTANDGEDALLQLRKRPADVVVSDVMMPRLGGFGLLRKLRADPLLHTIPLILLSARAGEEAAVEGLEAGADDYLVKPFSARELLARVQTQLAMTRLRAEAAVMRERERALDHAVKTRDDFLSVASHELKTPLASLKLHVESFTRALPEGLRQELGERITNLKRQTQRMGRLVERLLDVSQVATGRLQLQRVETDVAQLVNDGVAQCRDELTRAGCDVTVQVDQPLKAVVDPVRLEQTVLNLLGNAAKFGAGHPVEVAAWTEASQLILRVTDHGIGVEPAERERIFGRFERGVSARSYGGLGLGLWIAHEVVQAHGGTVHVDATNGGGATFTAQIPA